MKRLLLLCNAAASHGTVALDQGLSFVRDSGLEIDEHHPESADHMGRLIREHARRVDAVVVGGGDGTINAALPHVLEAGLPLGVLPLGTANDFARTLGIPADLESACAIIAAQATRRIDVGWANDRPFLNAAGIGMSTRLTVALSSNTKRRLGGLSYPAAVMQTFRDFRPFRARLKTPDGTRRIHSIQITVGNGVYYGGGTPVAEDSAIDDGRLDLYSVRPQPLGRLLAVAFAVRFGAQRQLPDGILTASGQTFEVTTARRMRVNLDGEPLLHTPVRFTVDPGRLDVLAPPPA